MRGDHGVRIYFEYDSFPICAFDVPRPIVFEFADDSSK